MDGAHLRIFYVFTDLILPLFVGYWLHRWNWIGGAVCNRLISFNIVIICTILSVLSFWVLPLTAKLVWLPVFGIVLCIIPGIISYPLATGRYENLLERGSYLASSMLSNIGTMGGICAFILYGEIGFAYVQMVGLFQNLALVLFFFPMAQYYRQRHDAFGSGKRVKLDLRRMFLHWHQLPVVGMAVGMGFYLFEVPRLPILGTVFNAMVHIGAWLALIPVGYLIDFAAARRYYGRIWDLLPIKFIFTPLAVYFMATYLFEDPILLGTMVVLAVTPTAINAVVTARLFRLDVDLTIAAFILTTVVYLCVVFPTLFFLLATGRSS